MTKHLNFGAASCREEGEIPNAVGTDLYSVQVYDGMDFDTFNPAMKFEKWAAIEVTDFSAIPDGMKESPCRADFMPVFYIKERQAPKGRKHFATFSDLASEIRLRAG